LPRRGIIWPGECIFRPTKEIIRPGPGEHQPGPAGIPQSGPTRIGKGILEGKSRPGQILLIWPSQGARERAACWREPSRGRRSAQPGAMLEGAPQEGEPARGILAWELILAHPARGSRGPAGELGPEAMAAQPGRRRLAQPGCCGSPGCGAEGPTGAAPAGPTGVGGGRDVADLAQLRKGGSGPSRG
jgi:hypothetical protein